MALHKDFPTDPHAILDPAVRWFPADESLRDTTMDKLMPPLVPALRKKVKEFRDGGYVGATKTSKSLLNWWFKEPHLAESADGTTSKFEYFFAQREAMETIVYLVDVVGVKDKFDLMRFDGSGLVSAGMFDETWRRFVVKMATGSGKTKVLSMALAWSFFHKLYEPESTLARNFLVIAPNIIVLDRIYKDFQGLKIFLQSDPTVPDNGFDGQNWRDDFQLTLHVQDDVRVTRKTGNIFLTNIHRVYAGNESIPSAEDEDTMDYFLGTRPSGATTDSKVDLGMIVRDIDELMVLNDEAHHIHDAKLAWFESIQDIHNKLKQKDGHLSLQLDVTATPKHNNGAIFVQTIADYPLVEAISQNVVKHPVLPDAPSRAKLQERKSIKYTEKYADYIDLGVIEWRKAYKEHQKAGKKAVLFVMTDDTKNCDDVAEYLRGHYPDLAGDAVLVIHTKSNGEISEASSGKAKEELELLRKQANAIDDLESPAKAIVSVMMLKEGWDVRNVTTIVGLRAYAAKSNILPEQTLGRGLRKMYPGGVEEYVSVIGTDAFMEFVESIQAEGVVLERKAMGAGTKPKAPLVVEVDEENEKKDLDELDIPIPVMTPRVYREYKNLASLNLASMNHQTIAYQSFSEEEQREIVFKDITTGAITHTTILDTAGVADYRSVIGYFAQTVMKELRLVSGYDVLYGKVKRFVQDHLFGQSVDLEHPNTIRNLSELAATKTLIDSFKKSINDLTVEDKGDAKIRDTIKLRQVRPFVTKDQGYLLPKKSVFNRIIGDSPFELDFAKFLEDADDVVSYVKNYMAIGFKLDYVNADGDISNYYPDFVVKLPGNRVVIAETKGWQDVDVEPKMKRLQQWCEDVNRLQNDTGFDYVYVEQAAFEQFRPKTMADLLAAFLTYKTSGGQAQEIANAGSAVLTERALETVRQQFGEEPRWHKVTSAIMERVRTRTDGSISLADVDEVSELHGITLRDAFSVLSLLSAPESGLLRMEFVQGKGSKSTTVAIDEVAARLRAWWREKTLTREDWEFLGQNRRRYMVSRGRETEGTPMIDSLAALIDWMEINEPDYVALVTAKTDDEFDAALLPLFTRAVDHLESNSKNYHSDGETGLTATVVASMSGFGLRVTQETNSNGHVDVTIKGHLLRPEQKRLGEAKLYDGYEYHVGGLKQLLGYMTGRASGYLLNYVRKRKIADLVKKLRDRMDIERPCEQSAPCTDYDLKWSFSSVHDHSSGERVKVTHIGFNVFVDGAGDD